MDSEKRVSAPRGVGRLLVAVYGLLAAAATARSLVQILRDFGYAPLAYTLSGIAAVVYILATVALAKGGPTWQRIARVTIWFELVGVLVVGAMSVTLPHLFPDETVWGFFGLGYGFVPLILPILGLLWLRRVRTPSENESTMKR